MPIKIQEFLPVKTIGCYIIRSIVGIKKNQCVIVMKDIDYNEYGKRSKTIEGFIVNFTDIL